MSAMPLARALLTGTFLIGFAGSALALDGTNFAKSLNAGLAYSGGTVTFSKADVDGGTVTLHDAALKAAGHTLHIGDLTFSDVEEKDNGGYSAGKMTMPDIDYKRGKGEITIDDIEIDGLELPSPQLKEGEASILVYQSASTGAIRATRDKHEMFALSGVKSTVGTTSDPEAYNAKVVGSGLVLHLDRMVKPKLREAIDALGYDTVKGRFVEESAWKVKSGEIDMSRIGLELDDVGTLDIAMKLNGYTKSFMQSLNGLRAKAMTHPKDPEARKSLGIGMLGLMQQLNFESAAISFKDDSLTRKVLDYTGKKQGVSGDQMAKLAGAMLPLVLGKLKNPQFEQQISHAVSKFLDDPKNITIKAAPANPVSLPIVFSTVIGSPQSLPDILGVSVTANK